MLKKILLRVIPFLFISNAFALNLQGYQFSDSYRYSLLEDSLKEKFEGRYVVTASYSYINSPFYYSDTYLHDLRGEIIEGNNILTGGFSWYLHKNLALGLDLNLIKNTVFDDAYTTLADTVIKSKINLKRTESFSLSLNPKVYLPTGKEENFSSMGTVGGAISLVAEKSFERLHFLISAGALSSKDNRYAEVDHRQLLLTQLGVSYDFTEKFNLNLESYRNIPLVDDILQDEGKYFLTGKHKTHSRLSTYFGAGVTGWGEVQRNTYSAFFGIKLHETPVMQTVAHRSAAPERQSARIPADEIYFPHDRYHLENKQKEKLEEYLDYLKENDKQKVILEGHASRPGLPDYNMRLSRKRAISVRDYLIEHGISQDKLSIEAFGESAPQHAEEWKNRKVNFNFKQ